jgi:hypothetical protein
MEEQDLEKGKVKGFAAHFSKAAAFHKAHGMAHGEAADAHETMGMACKAMQTEFEGKVKKSDGGEDEMAKAQGILFKAHSGFHSAMAKVHDAMSKAHTAHGEHCEMCAKAAPENFELQQPTGGKEESGEAKGTKPGDLLKAQTDFMAKLEEVSTRLGVIDAKLTKVENQPEALPPGLRVVPHDGEAAGVRKLAPAQPDVSGGLRKAV